MYGRFRRTTHAVQQVVDRTGRTYRGCSHVYQRNALTLKELQSIQSLTDHPVQAAETLLNIIMEQPDAVYLCFLDVLKQTEQHHVYQRLVEGGYSGE